MSSCRRNYLYWWTTSSKLGRARCVCGERGGDEVVTAYVNPVRLSGTDCWQDMDAVLEMAYCLRGEIRSATSSLTSVPKPLKLLVGSYDDLKGLFEDLKLKVALGTAPRGAQREGRWCVV